MKKGIWVRIDQGDHGRWDTYLPDIVFNLRRRRNAAIGQTPSHLLLGKTIQRPGEWRFDNDGPTEMTDLNTGQEQARRQQEALVRERGFSGFNRYA